MEKLCPGDAIVEENSRLFGQPENLILYLLSDCTISGNISEAVGVVDVIIEVLGRVVWFSVDHAILESTFI